MKESYRSLMDNMSGLLYQPVNVVNTKQDHQKEQTKRVSVGYHFSIMFFLPRFIASE